MFNQIIVKHKKPVVKFWFLNFGSLVNGFLQILLLIYSGFIAHHLFLHSNFRDIIVIIRACKLEVALL